MNLIQFSFSNAYIYSPITWLHKANTQCKILIIFILLCLIPHLTFRYLLIITINVFVIIVTLKFDENYYHSCRAILFIAFICSLPHCINETNYIRYKILKIYKLYQIPYFLIKNKNLIVNENISIQLKIPEFIIQTGIITLLYLIILKTLLLTTMHEHIMLSICMYMKINNNYLKSIIFISSFASQFLEQMIKNIKILYISAKLRDINSAISMNQLSIYYYIITKFLKHIKYNIQRVTSILYSRELNDKILEVNEL
uniref:hypothetical protein n=1 Tax=Polyopes affinis TaxID=194519 RepID=UPI002A7F8D63|nr:hypothetical protein NDC12_pgp016 [Polyopes affinis]WOL37120.1 hypothetical protein [Polyopes affinis]